MYYITILDFANGSVDQYDLNNQKNIENWQSEDFENFLLSEGYNLGNIEWMSHSNNAWTSNSDNWIPKEEYQAYKMEQINQLNNRK